MARIDDTSTEGWGVVDSKWHFFRRGEDVSICGWFLRSESSSNELVISPPKKGLRCDGCERRKLLEHYAA